MGALRELKRRWQGVTLHLRTFQEPAIQEVTKQRDIGLIAILVILTSWANTSFPYGLVKGLPAVGYAPPYGIFPQQPATRISMDDVLEGWEQHNQHILIQLKPGKDDAFLLQQSMEDAAYGFCTAPMTKTSLPSTHPRTSSPPDPKMCDHPEFWQTASHRQRRHWRTIRTLLRCQQVDPVQSSSTSEAYQLSYAPMDT